LLCEFLRNMKVHHFLFSIIVCIVMTGLSRVTEAMPVPEKTEKTLTNHSDSLSILDSLVEETRITNNRLSLLYAKRALILARQSGKAEDLVKAYIIKGTGFNTNDKDSSYFYFSNALKLADSAGLLKQKVRINYNLAILNNTTGDYKKGIALLDSTIRLSGIAKEYALMANAYNALGGIYNELQDTTNARHNFEMSFQISEDHSLYRQMGAAFGNLSIFQGDNKKGIKQLKIAISYLMKAKGTEEEIPKFYIDIGNRNNKPDSALFYYQKALQIAKYGNLPNIEINAYNNMVYSYLDKKEYNKAKVSLEKALLLAIKTGNIDMLSSLYDSYADVFYALKKSDSAFHYERMALHKRKEADTRQATGQVRLLAAQLDVKNKELIIQNTETELLVQKNRLQQTKLWLAVSVLFVIVSVFVLLSLMQRNKMKLQNQQITSARRLIEMEESEKGRTARDLHDITGQLIMGITGAVEKLDLPDDRNKAEIQAKIKDLGRSIRAISHRMNKAMLEHFTFKELITGQCEDIEKLTGMCVQLDMPEGIYDLPEEMVLHTYRIVQELLTNASKYVSESTVRISFINRNNNLIMSYSDNGKGFDSKEIKNHGMGIMNIFERTKLLGGKAKLTSSPGNGTKWEILIPRRIRKKSSLKKVNV